MQRRTVNFVVGADALAPGVSRVISPLLEGLTASRDFEVRPQRFPTMAPALFYPYLFGGLPLQLLTRPASLLHLGNAWYAHVVPWISCPSVVTCHHPISSDDLHQGHRRPGLHRLAHLRIAMRGMLRARRIVCDSRSVADHIAWLAPQSEDKLRVIYPGVSHVFRTVSATVNSESDTYVLYVGSEQQRKNLQRLVIALALARKEIPELRFVKVGSPDGPEGRDAFEKSLNENGLLGATTILESVSDFRLAQLYGGASVTVLPSLQEGFGFPPLEAMACGCPAIVSNRGSLPETAGDAALIVDPLDPRGMARAIVSVVKNKELRSELVQRGLQRSAKFDPRKTIEQYEEVYAEVLGQ